MHLEKHFKFKDILALVVGSIVGSGVFYLAPKVFSITNSPGLAIMVWAFAGIITVAAGLTVAETSCSNTKNWWSYRIYSFRIWRSTIYNMWLGICWNHISILCSLLSC
jgi:hypothetical protein